MNARKTISKVVAAATLASVLATGALANQLAGALITGQVTAISGSEWITIDGKSYRIQSGSPAATAVRSVSKGQRVDIRLNGPPNTAASAVVIVTPHQGP